MADTGRHGTVLRNALTEYEREALEKFLDLSAANEIIQVALVANQTGSQLMFKAGAEATLAFVAYGDEAHVYKHAITGIEQAVGLTQAKAVA